MGISTGNKVRPRLLALDLIRGLAAFVVLISHLRGDCFVEYGALPASQHTVIITLFFTATRIAHEAVLVFFVLSGFVVGGEVFARVRGDRFHIFDYSVGRATRILIPLIPICLFTAAITFFLTKEFPPAGELFGNMVGLNEILTKTLVANAVLWSLSYEIWFYVFAGAAAYSVSQRPNVASVLTLIICATVFTILDAHYLVIWMLGACASLLVEVKAKKVLFVSGVFLLLVATYVYQVGTDSRSVVPTVYLPSMATELLFSVGIAMTFPMLISPAANNLLSRFSMPVNGLAAFSYTLYLTHRPTNAVLATIFGKADVISSQSLLTFALRILICLAVAICFYLCFERNTGKARKILRNQLPNSPIIAKARQIFMVRHHSAN